MTSTRANARTSGRGGGTGRSLVAGPSRRRLLRLCAIAAVVFAALSVLVAHRTGPIVIDRGIDPVVAGWFDGHRWLARDLADLGGTAAFVALSAVVTVGWLARRHWRGALLTLVAPISAVCLVEYVLKPLVHRPATHYLAFPSGHTTSIAAIASAFVLALTAHRVPWRPTGRALLACVAAAALPAAAAIGLIAAGYHYVTDTIGGLLVSGVTVAVVALGIDGLAERRAKRQPHQRAASGTSRGPGG